MVEQNDKKWLPYVKWSIADAICVAFVFAYEKPFAEESVAEIMGKICNCFFVPGSLFVALSVLGLLANKGTYDSFGYIFSNFSLHNIFMKNQPKKYQNLYDYKQDKAKNRKPWVPTGVIVGGATMAISLIFFILYKVL